MAKYTDEVVKKVDLAIPQAVRDALNKMGWNELGIYEEVKKEGGEILKT